MKPTEHIRAATEMGLTFILRHSDEAAHFRQLTLLGQQLPHGQIITNGWNAE
jgi:hypothetical protein